MATPKINVNVPNIKGCQLQIYIPFLYNSIPTTRKWAVTIVYSFRGVYV